jgi:FkbM family methyltransferase
MNIIQKIPLTKLKIFIAGILYHVIKVLKKQNEYEIRRNNINYKVDLSEGIDFSIYLFGTFQKHIFNSKLFGISKDSCILDIGANIGAITLSFAQIAANGSVYAIEPTDFAYNKLITNLALNPELKYRIHPFKLFISEKSEGLMSREVYSSWKIDKKQAGAHGIHCGIAKPVTETDTLSLDDFAQINNITKIDFIKIDTDGHEWDIFKGGVNTIKTCKPVIVFEVGKYILKEHGQVFSQFINLFSSLNYKLYSSVNNKEITIKNFDRYIPLNYTVDVVAIPD